ncbi:MAG: pantetheine-phosphate adenylyltransferase [Nitriliruptoraceae bacterium]
MTVTAVCPGSFDPVTYGHLDVIERAARRFDEVIVAVVDNPNKSSLFTLDERVDMVEQLTSSLRGVRIESFDGLLVDFCRAHGVGIVCKGVRGVADFEYEQQMAQMNLRIGDVETVFLPARPDHAYLSSSLVKEVARLGGSVAGTVPADVERALIDRLASDG